MRGMASVFMATALCAAAPLSAQAQDTSDAGLSVSADLSETDSARVPLYLEVTLNGKPTNLVAEFALDPGNGRMFSPKSELEQIGLRGKNLSAGMVDLRSITGLRFTYDEAGQKIDLQVPIAAMRTEVVSAMPEAEQLAPERSYGAVLNYSVDAGLQKQPLASDIVTTAASFDGWIFAPFGVLRSSGVVRDLVDDAEGRTGLRLETTYQLSSPKRRLTLAVGDVQSSALAWSRSIRMGGVQLRRDFGLRSDLITQQLLSFNGAAAVPSSVDVFIDNNRAYSTGRDAGPFRLEDLPVRAGAGEALIVVTDANGRRTTKAVSFYVSRKLLKKGLLDFSIEAGDAREGYGLESNDYGSDGFISGSLRFGLTERVTLEAQVQSKSDLRMAGLGLTTVPFDLAELSLAAGASDYAGTTASFAYGAVQTQIGPVEVSGSVRWAQKGFADLAYVTGVDYLGQAEIEDSASLLEVPTLQTALSLSVPVGGGGSFGVGYVSSTRSSSRDELVTASYGRDLGLWNGSLSVYGSHDMQNGDTRAAVGLSVPLGKRKSLRATNSVDPEGNVLGGIYVARTISDQQGDYGYAAEVQRDSAGEIRFSGRGDYLGRYGQVGLELRTGDGSTGLRGQLDGAVAMAGGAVAFGSRVNDSFAIVDVGAAGVPVSVHNRPVALTGRNGKALVTGMQSNHRNRVSVDLDDLPADLALDASGMDVVPGIGSGVRVKFHGDSDNSAVVVLLDGRGNPIEAGSVATLKRGGEEFFVGFGGETLVQGLKGKNRLTVQLETGSCTANFGFTPRSGALQTIDAVRCQ
ncbi:fimbrial biogenesis outer membrane usher protein [Cypionkella aquatica]|uniref:Fimbrial biogenesis outer membrane usher protein n=1 Tax=Cypionkella aquatica TaxID=1756042 RepID=A0AA37WZV7_9RHOB|nr:fimbria/pilus outer membrane usher protein [Cypionkella aquatica]GLS86149.1 fimbrial biogenesis outer membrane usher protein [Cypionkella aquatica]